MSTNADMSTRADADTGTGADTGRDAGTGTDAPGPRADVRSGVRRASAFLARRSLKAHRRAWAAVFAATTAAATLIGAFAFVVGSLLLAQPPVDRYAGADAVVAADQQVTYTAKPWGSKPQTAKTYLPERVRLDRSAVAKAAAADGVAKAVADDSVPVAVGGGTGGGPASGVGRSWESAALTPYRLTDGHAPRTPTEVVVDSALAAAVGSKPGSHVTLQVDGAPARTPSAVSPTPGIGAPPQPSSSPGSG